MIDKNCDLPVINYLNCSPYENVLYTILISISKIINALKQFHFDDLLIIRELPEPDPKRFRLIIRKKIRRVHDTDFKKALALIIEE